MNRLPSLGFTLPEVAAIVAIVGILAAITGAVASDAMHASRAAEARAALLDTYQTAIRHASLHGVHVVVCPVDTTGACRDGTDWSGGWIAFEDPDGDRGLGAGDRVLNQWPRLGHGTRVLSTIGRKRLVFQPTGGNAGSNVTFTLCDGRGAGQASQLVIANDGRLRESRAPAASATECMTDP